jgi:hypothetical protein
VGAFESWRGVQGLVGVTQVEPDRTRSLGVYDQEDEGAPDRVGRGAIAIERMDESAPLDILTDQSFRTSPSLLLGNWLVRTPRPHLLNRRFDEDVSSWTPEFFAAVDWDAMDVDDSPVSGSARVENTCPPANCFRGIQQCVEVTPGASYEIETFVYIPSQAVAGIAQVGAFWGSDLACTFLASIEYAPEVSTQGQWIRNGPVTLVAPPGAHSAQVVASIKKIDADGSFQAFFDDVSIVPAPEPSATLLCSAALLALAGLRRLGHPPLGSALRRRSSARRSEPLQDTA